MKFDFNYAIPKTLTASVLILAAVTALISIIRPEIYLPFTAADYIAESTGQDIFTLILSIGLLSALFTRKAFSSRFMLISIGCHWYLFYAYSIYAYGGVYTPLFFFYPAIMKLSLVSSLLLGGTIYREIILNGFPEGESGGTKRNLPARLISARLVSALFLMAAALLIWGIWCSSIMEHISAGTKARETVIYVNDLSIVLPVFLLSGILLLTKQKAGIFFGTICLVKAVTIGGSIMAGQAVKGVQGMELDIFLATFFAIFTLTAAGASISLLKWRTI